MFFDFSTFLGKVTNLVFRIRLKIISKNSNFKIQYLYVKRSLQNLKITKSTKTYLHQTRGNMADFKVNQKNVTKVRKCNFCVAFTNMYPWCSLQIKDVFFTFFKFGGFCEEFANLIFDRSTFNLFLRISILRFKI